MTEKQFNKGDVIFRENDNSDGFYQLMSGKVGVYVNYGTEEELKLRELEPGQYFGELAALESRRRSATIAALEDNTSVNFIPDKEFAAFFENRPSQIIIVMRQISAQIRELTKDYNEVTAAIQNLKNPNPQPQKESLRDKVKKFLSSHKNEQSVAELEQAEHSKGFTTERVNSYPKGTIIFREGEAAGCMYDIHFGRVGIYSGYGTPDEKMLVELFPNKFFGEMGMIDNEPRSATAVAMCDETTLETIYPEDLIVLMEKNPMKVDMIMQHLSYRLRRLTIDYTKACNELAALSNWG